MRSLVLIAASTAAAIVHLALGPEHLEELGGLGLGFYAAGLLQLGWAVLASMAVLPGRNGRWRLARAAVPAGIALNVALLLAWLISRTVGLPAGERPWTPEAFGLSDGITALLEAGIVIGLLGTIWSGARRGELSRHVAPPVRRRGVRPSRSSVLGWRGGSSRRSVRRARGLGGGDCHG